MRIEGGECVVEADLETLEAIEFPDTVQDVVRGRVDGLTPDQQMTLKSASIIGRTFSLDGLGEVHPLESDVEAIRQQLQTMAGLELVAPADESDESFTFRHAITLDVTYNLMPFSQRQELHRRAATWYQREYSTDQMPVFSILAHHWSLSDEPVRALEYLEKAGWVALSRFNNQEAIDLFGKALEIADSKPEGAKTIDRARWNRLLGIADT